MPKRGSDADSRVFFDELESLAASRLKATGAIRLEDRQVLIPFGEQNKLIAVAHTKFPNGGAWSYLVCPKCGRRAKRLWLVDDARLGGTTIVPHTGQNLIRTIKLSPAPL